jgi:hypothetical protein
MAKNSSFTTKVANHPKLLRMYEVRAPPSAIARAENKLAARIASESDGDVMEIVVLNRAASDLDALDKFYAGMQTTTTMSVDGLVSKHCYLWTWATVDVCFTSRPDNATSTKFSVVNFEEMLKSTHETVVTGGETCNNKWVDNHYAIDGAWASADYIITFIEENAGIFYYCEFGTLHYIVDPTGWAVQLDLTFPTASNICSAAIGRKLPPPSGDGYTCPCTGMTACGVSAGAGAGPGTPAFHDERLGRPAFVYALKKSVVGARPWPLAAASLF